MAGHEGHNAEIAYAGAIPPLVRLLGDDSGMGWEAAEALQALADDPHNAELIKAWASDAAVLERLKQQVGSWVSSSRCNPFLPYNRFDATCPRSACFVKPTNVFFALRSGRVDGDTHVPVARAYTFRPGAC